MKKEKSRDQRLSKEVQKHDFLPKLSIGRRVMQLEAGEITQSHNPFLLEKTKIEIQKRSRDKSIVKGKVRLNDEIRNLS